MSIVSLAPNTSTQELNVSQNQVNPADKKTQSVAKNFFSSLAQFIGSFLLLVTFPVSVPLLYIIGKIQEAYRSSFPEKSSQDQLNTVIQAPEAEPAVAQEETAQVEPAVVQEETAQAEPAVVQEETAQAEPAVAQEETAQAEPAVVQEETAQAKPAQVQEDTVQVEPKTQKTYSPYINIAVSLGVVLAAYLAIPSISMNIA